MNFDLCDPGHSKIRTFGHTGSKVTYMLVQKLQSLDLLGAISPMDMDALAKKMRMREIDAGVTVMMEGDIADDAYLILSGTVRIEKTSSDGKEVLIDILGPGEILGEMGLITQETRSASAVAHTDCVLAVMDSGCFSFLRGLKPEINERLLKILSTRLQEVNARLRDVSLMPLDARLASVLTRFTEQYGVRNKDGIMLNLPLTQSDLAHLAACSREHVSKTFKEWERAGIVARKTTSITVCKPDALKKIMEEV